MKNTIIKSVVWAIAFMLTIGIIGFSYAALTTVSQGDNLTADMWNQVVTQLDNLNTEVWLDYDTDWVTLLGIPLSCKDILSANAGSTDWVYTIDPEDNWTWFEVYCDMTTEWWGWTLVATISTSAVWGLSPWWTDITNNTVNWNNLLQIGWSALWNNVKYQLSDYKISMDFSNLSIEEMNYWFEAVKVWNGSQTYKPSCSINWTWDFANCWTWNSSHYWRVHDPSTYGACWLYHTSGSHSWWWSCWIWSGTSWKKWRIWVR